MTRLCFASFILLILVIPAVLLGDRSASWDWAVRCGGPGTDNGRAIVTDSDGNCYVTGRFEYNATFGDSTLNYMGWADCFIAKLDSQGEYLWVKQVSGVDDEISLSIALDNAGNLYVAGYFSGICWFDSLSVQNSGFCDIFVAKMDSSGNWLWAQRAGGEWSSDMAFGVAVDPVGNVYVTGYFDWDATFGTTTLYTTDKDCFVAKLDSDGNWLWAEQSDSAGSEEAKAICVDDSGNAYITGCFNENVTFGTSTLIHDGFNDTFIAKLDTNGNWLWATDTSSPGDDTGENIALSGSNTLYVTGSFELNCGFGDFLRVSRGATDAFIAKLDTGGNWLWAGQMGGTGSDYCYGLDLDSAGNVYLAGSFEGTAYIGAIPVTASGAADIFAAGLNSDNIWRWVLSAGGAGNDRAYAIAVSSGGYPVLTGEFADTAVFGGESVISEGDTDCFMARCGFIQELPDDWLWAERVGGSGQDAVNDMVTDADENTYVTGYFHQTVAFGVHVLNASAYQDAFVAKQDRNGEWLWALALSGSGNENGRAVALDSSGNVYVTGTFTNSLVGADNTLTSNGSQDAFIIKLDNLGQEVWLRQAGGPLQENASGIVINSNSTACVLMSFEGTAQFGPYNLTSFGQTDICVVRIDSSGNFTGVSRAGGSSDEIGVDIDADLQGNVYLTGYYIGNLSFGSVTLVHTGSTNCFTAKMDSTGAFAWAKQNLGTGSAMSLSIAVDGNGNSYVSGRFSQDVSFGSYNLSNTGTNTDVYVVKLDGSGSFQWASSAGGTGEEYPWKLAMNGNDNIYLTGYFDSATSTFGSTILTCTNQYTDVFLAQINTDGTWSWACSVSGGGSDRGLAISCSSTGNVTIAGTFDANLTFGSFYLTANGLNDMYFARLISEPLLTGAPLAPQNPRLSVVGMDILMEWDPVTLDVNGQPVSPEYKVYGTFSEAMGYNYYGETADTHWLFSNWAYQPVFFFYVTAAR